MRSDLQLLSLREQILEGSTKLFELNAQFKEFCCVRDEDVQTFIRDRAIRYERSGLSRTYFYVTDRETEETDVAAYFSVAITSVDYTRVSRARREKVLGSTPGRVNRDHFGGLLIAQIARDDRFNESVISGTELIEACEEIIELGRNYLGGRVIYLDCKEELISLYERRGYKLLLDSPFENGLYKMTKTLPRL
ncbi:MAG: hypothetical protein LBJ48_01605 [Coriobacteriales bacterium]|jgi:hypothetical protein|nr:hypothetical protein [Coriobacteriales bacterium]